MIGVSWNDYMVYWIGAGLCVAGTAVYIAVTAASRWFRNR